MLKVIGHRERAVIGVEGGHVAAEVKALVTEVFK
jgi:hypothetical protein